MAVITSTTGTLARERALALEPQFDSSFDFTALSIAICGAFCWIAPAAAWLGGML